MNMVQTRADNWGGQLLAFSGLDGTTSFAHGLVARTSLDLSGIEVRLPERARLVFPQPVSVQLSGDWLVWILPAGVVRGVFLDAFHLLVEGPCTVERLDAGLSSHVQGNRLLVGATPRFDADLISADVPQALPARSAWMEGLRFPSHLSEPTRRTLTKALSVMKSQVCTPEGPIAHRWTTPDRWPHRRMWLWDSVFHAIGWRHLDPALARDMISAVFDRQQADGFIPHMMDPQKISPMTQPPVLALGVSLVLEKQAAPEWLAELYPKLCAYLRWDMANRDSDGGGLLEWDIEGDPNCRSGESGMDNSPRFDSATRLDAMDFNSFLAHECELLADFARQLGHTEGASEWAAHAERLNHLIQTKLWSPTAQFFMDYDVEWNHASSILASSGFMPLVCGAATSAQAAALVAHLKNPSTFGTAFPVPSVAACHTDCYAKDMWRGPTWINMNWLIARGLDRYGYYAEAAQLRLRTRQEIETYCEAHGSIFEFYDDRGEVPPTLLLRKGKCAPQESPIHQVFHDYGWSCTLYADLVFTQT